MEIGDRVKTPHGNGTITGFDLEGSDLERIVLKLDNNPFFYNNVCFWKHQIEKIKE